MVRFHHPDQLRAIEKLERAHSLVAEASGLLRAMKQETEPVPAEANRLTSEQQVESVEKLYLVIRSVTDAIQRSPVGARVG